MLKKENLSTRIKIIRIKGVTGSKYWINTNFYTGERISTASYFIAKDKVHIAWELLGKNITQNELKKLFS